MSFYAHQINIIVRSRKERVWAGRQSDSQASYRSVHHTPERIHPTRQEYHALGVSAENLVLNLYPAILCKSEASKYITAKKLSELTINSERHLL